MRSSLIDKHVSLLIRSDRGLPRRSAGQVGRSTQDPTHKVVMAGHTSSGIQATVQLALLTTAHRGSRHRSAQRSRDRRLASARVINMRKVNGEGADIGGRHVRKSAADNGSHRAGGRSMQGRHADSEKAEQLVFGPRDGRGVGSVSAGAIQSSIVAPAYASSAFPAPSRLRGVWQPPQSLRPSARYAPRFHSSLFDGSVWYRPLRKKQSSIPPAASGC